MKSKVNWVVLGLLLVAAVLGYCGFRTWRLVAQGIPEAYAGWDCATLVVEHMATHGGAWPRNWEELLAAATALPDGNRFLHGCSMNDVQKIRALVRVDWTADPKQLSRAQRRDDDPPFMVITRADGSALQTIWEGTEPNTLVWEYLQALAVTNTPTKRLQPFQSKRQ